MHFFMDRDASYMPLCNKKITIPIQNLFRCWRLPFADELIPAIGETQVVKLKIVGFRCSPSNRPLLARLNDNSPE